MKKINIKNKVVLSALVLTLVAISLWGTGTAFAQNTVAPHSSLIQKIAQKFGLQEREVQAVFEEEHAVREAEMQTKLAERLSELVTEGKITEAQKQLLLTKHQELQAVRQSEFESMKDATLEERKAMMDQKRQELDAWAQENGIDPQYLHLQMGRVMKGRMPH